MCRCKHCKLCSEAISFYPCIVGNKYNCGCSNGNWIPRNKKCNGDDDCGDNSDEGESAGCGEFRYTLSIYIC